MKWISVKERLPEDSSYVIVFSSGWESGVQAYYDPDGEFWARGGYHDDVLKGVTHWMPMPKGPNDIEYHDYPRTTNYDLISFDQYLFDEALREAQEHYQELDCPTPDDVGFKEIAQYVNSKPFPYKPQRLRGNEDRLLNSKDLNEMD